jgi:hypothetical protein
MNKSDIRRNDVIIGALWHVAIPASLTGSNWVGVRCTVGGAALAHVYCLSAFQAGIDSNGCNVRSCPSAFQAGIDSNGCNVRNVQGDTWTARTFRVSFHNASCMG